MKTEEDCSSFGDLHFRHGGLEKKKNVVQERPTPVVRNDSVKVVLSREKVKQISICMRVINSPALWTI